MSIKASHSASLSVLAGVLNPRFLVLTKLFLDCPLPGHSSIQLNQSLTLAFFLKKTRIDILLRSYMKSILPLNAVTDFTATAANS